MSTSTPSTMSSGATARRKPTSTTSKLRDSCQACALSKVKCPKEKPSCSRCAKRGIACEYFMPKRPGRKRESSCNQSDIGIRHPRTPTIQSGLATAWYSPDISATLPDLNASLIASTRLSSVTQASSCPGMIPDIITSPEVGVSLEGSEVSQNPSGLLTSPVEFSESGSFDCSFSSCNQAVDNVAELYISNEGGPETSTRPISQAQNITLDLSSFATERQDPPAYLNQASSGIPALEPRCHCMGDVLCLLSKLLPPLISRSGSLSTGSNLIITRDDTTDTEEMLPLQRTQIAIMENKQFIEAVSNILQCSCAERGYLLAMLCTVILKILERYRAAAQMNTVTGQSIPYRIAASHRSRQPSSPASSRDTSRTQQIASQLVLGELHRLQVLLARLSLRIDWDEREPGMGTGSEYCSEPANDWQGRTNHEDFSAAALRQMQTDLQNCLSRLSSDLIGILRHA